MKEEKMGTKSDGLFNRINGRMMNSDFFLFLLV
jgi:hypothetical protein